MKKAIYKVPNGKLLKIFLEENDGAIVSIKITGDFFLYPEENIEKLEKALTRAQKTSDTLARVIDIFFTTTPTTLFGVDKESLVTTIMNAV